MSDLGLLYSTKKAEYRLLGFFSCRSTQQHRFCSKRVHFFPQSLDWLILPAVLKSLVALCKNIKEP